MPITNPKNNQQQDSKVQKTDCANAPLKLAAIKSEAVESGSDNEKRTKNGKFTMAQLRQTDGIVPLQSGTNQYDSQRGMTGFGCPRDVKGKHLKRIWELEFPEEAVTDQPAVNQSPQQQSNTNIQLQ